MVNLLRIQVVSLLRIRWSIYSEFGWSIWPFFPAEVSVFSWAKLAGNNDGHILCAAYLNLIGDIYVHCRQQPFRDAWQDEDLIDKYGNKHIIKKFRTYKELQDEMLRSSESAVFFDIDLDFFSVKNGLSDGSFKFTYLKEDEIREMLDKDNPLISHSLKSQFLILKIIFA